ncbi:hypothetical protein [Streptomyces sp. JV178]|uniref:hypothetical protein n=1 Tax=Streptomyces sp. JV178 TaxID=858632 RepID=UPI00117BF1CF|nr:hypothetical protein [Streptomyces sp. JV178]
MVSLRWQPVMRVDKQQAAGRINREGHRPTEDSIMTVFEPTDDMWLKSATLCLELGRGEVAGPRRR